jgi:hypothetical protein
VALGGQERHIIYGLSLIVFGFCQIVFRVVYPDVRATHSAPWLLSRRIMS